MSDDLLESLDMSNMTEEEKKAALEIEARAKELERATSGQREFKQLGVKIIIAVAACYSIFQIYNVFGGLTALRQRAIHLVFAIIICMVKFSANRNMGANKEPWMPYAFLGIGFWTAIVLMVKGDLTKAGLLGVILFFVIFGALFVSRIFTAKWRLNKGDSHETTVLWYDFVIIAFGIVGCLYIAIFADDILQRAGIVLVRDQIIGFFLILVVLETTRRSVGLVLMWIGLFMIFYSLGNKAPIIGPIVDLLPFWNSDFIFWHPGFSVGMVIRHFILTDSGLWSTPLGVSASYIALFLLLGSALHASGLAELLLKVARGIFGTMVGGPAKMAVVASSMFAMISGSSTSNVATTGIVTIPLMKKTGIPPHLAGAVEASASMGGQITPPVMGAVAFIMAEFLGTSYLKVAIAAALPAALYYTAVYSMIHFESHRIGAIGLKKSEIPPWKRDAVVHSYLYSPVVVLVAMLILGWTPMMASLCSFILCCVLAMIRKQTRLNLKKFTQVLSSAGQTLTVVAIPSAIAGFVVGTATLTGLTNNMTKLLEVLAKDNLLITLIVTMIMSLILGMGVPTVANYILMTIMTVPIMLKAGVDPMAAHLFCFHFGIMSELTPPVAITSYTASAIAGAKFWPTAFSAVRLAAVAYIVPYLFVYNTALLLGQHPFHVSDIMTVLTALFGSVVFGSVMAGYQKRKLYMWERFVLAGSALCMISPKLSFSALGVLIFAAMLVWQFIYTKPPKGYKKLIIDPTVDH